ncbi:MAG: nucleotide-binding protein [Fervidobacterium sp.]|uniref:nucleotide-binding protein n=1 Tax=Fervidobacterium sp. TaxID=1871331 RepID=UPI00404B4157
MRKFLVALMLVLSVAFFAAKIADVYKVKEGETVEATGIVLAPVGVLGTLTTYMQDETAGIMLYGKLLPADLKVGQVIKVVGKTKVYYDILEIIPDKVEIIGTATPTAIELKDGDFKKYLSNLVNVVGTVNSVEKYQFTVKTDKFEILVYIRKEVPFSVSTLKVGDKVSVMGVMYLYKGMYEILPRTPEDIKKF